MTWWGEPVGASPAEDLLAIALTDVGEIRRREESFRLLFEANPLPMTICDGATLDLTAISDAARSLSQAVAKPAANLRRIWPDARPEHVRKLAEGAGALPVTLIQTDGSETHALVYGRMLSGDAVEQWLLAFVDVTERKRAEQRIERLANHDPLTGLLNRTAFMAGLERALSELSSRQTDARPSHRDVAGLRSIAANDGEFRLGRGHVTANRGKSSAETHAS